MGQEPQGQPRYGKRISVQEQATVCFATSVSLQVEPGCMLGSLYYGDNTPEQTLQAAQFTEHD